MVQSCAAINCTKRRKSGEKIKFHRFPKDPNLRNKWVAALRRSNYTPSSTAVICQYHFLEIDYVINVHGNKVLKTGAIPSVFKFPEHLLKEANEIRIIKQESVENVNNEQMTQSCSVKLIASPEIVITGQDIQPSCSYSSSEMSHEVQPSRPKLVNKKRGRLEPCYIGDFKESDLECPRKRKLYWLASQKAIMQYKLKQKYSTNQIRLKNKKIANLNSLLDELRTKNKVTSKVSNLFKAPKYSNTILCL